MLHKYSKEKQSLQLNLGDSESNVKILKWFLFKILKQYWAYKLRGFISTVVA